MKKIYNWHDHIRGEHTYHDLVLNNLTLMLHKQPGEKEITL